MLRRKARGGGEAPPFDLINLAHPSSPPDHVAYMIVLFIVVAFFWFLLSVFHMDMSHRGLLPVVDVVTAVDSPDYMQGVVALVNSTFANTKAARVRFIILVPVEMDAPSYQALFWKLFAQRYNWQLDSLQVKGFNTSRVAELVHHCSSKPNMAHKSYLNYARFYIPHLLPDVSRVIYIDCDMIVQEDLILAFNSLNNNKEVIAAVEQPSTYDHFFDFTKPIINQTYHPKERHFNAGFLVIDLERWRKPNVTRQVENWMQLHQRQCLWKFGSQPPLLLVFYRNYFKLSPLWNVEFLGYKDMKVDIADIKRAYVIHWNGKRKPWFGLWGPLPPSKKYLTPHPEYQQFFLKYYDQNLVRNFSADLIKPSF